jgi:hypothetical protein
MAGVVARYGETSTVPHLLPLSVDGLIIVASVSLVELGARLRDTTPGPIPDVHDAYRSAHLATRDNPTVPALPEAMSAVLDAGTDRLIDNCDVMTWWPSSLSATRHRRGPGRS